MNKTIIKENNSWTTKKELILQNWMDECNIYSKLYTYNVIHFEKIDKILSIISILVSAITGASLLNTNNDDTAKTRVIILIFGALSMINTFLQAIKEFLNLKSVINNNMIASRQNKMICIDIEAQLNLSRQERTNGKEFLISIKDRKNDLILNGPIISDNAWKNAKLDLTKNRIKSKIAVESSINDKKENSDSSISSDKRLIKRRPTMEVINMSSPATTPNSNIEINDIEKTFSSNSNNLMHNTTNTVFNLDKIDEDTFTDEETDEEIFLERINNDATNLLNNKLFDNEDDNISNELKIKNHQLNELKQELQRAYL